MSTGAAQMDWLDAPAKRARRRRGMKRSGLGTGIDYWQERAYARLLQFIEQRGDAPFLVEEFRRWARYRIPKPRDGRAFGAVVMRAKKAGVIQSCGTRNAASSNHSPKILWQRSTAERSHAD